MANPAPLIEKGFLQHRAGRFSEAELIYTTVLKHHPDNERALFLLGTLHCQTKRLASAVELLSKAVGLKPKFAEAYNSLANAYMELNDYERAERAYRTCIRLKPGGRDAFNNLSVLLVRRGVLSKQKGDFKRAQADFEEALALNPDNALALNNRGIVLKDQGELEAAMECYRKILASKPDDLEALCNLGVALSESGRLDEALESYGRALRLSPDNAQAHFNRATTLLLKEEFAAAWPDYEWRLKTPVYRAVLQYAQPPWDGSDPSGKRILIHGEQGIANEIYFASCFNDLLRRGAACHIECHPKLADLFRSSFPAAGVSARPLDASPSPLAQSAEFDFQAPMGSLLRFLRPNRESFSRNGPYLKPSAKKSEFWRKRVADLGGGLKIGISWKSRASDAANSSRAKGSTELEQWAPILTLPRACFVNLQYGDSGDEINGVEERLGVRIRDWEDLDQTNDLEALAAVMGSLDLILSINSTAAYLAGALGRPTWTLVPYSFGSAWPESEHESPWMPSLRFIRQERASDWGELISRIAGKLQQRPA